MDPAASLHARILGCRRCQEAGFIPLAAPVVSGRGDEHIMLIGQAPGQTELHVRRPFAGRAGRELFRWFDSIGISQDEFRANVYMTAVTKCFPGKAAGGAGDRRPSGAEMALCASFLDEQLALVNPEVLLLVGGMAIERFYPKQPLTGLIGHQLELEGRAVIPLPHPSGASRWLNVPAHRELLRQALGHVQVAWEQLIAPQPSAMFG